jgi:hypothetical protein
LLPIPFTDATDSLYQLPTANLPRSRTGPRRQDLADVFYLGVQLLSALVIAQSMIEKALLPLDPIGSGVKTFPIANDTTN